MSEKNNLDPAFRQPWLITPTWLSSLIDQANQVGPEAVAVTQGEALDGTDLVENRGNVAIVHIQEDRFSVTPACSPGFTGARPSTSWPGICGQPWSLPRWGPFYCISTAPGARSTAPMKWRK